MKKVVLQPTRSFAGGQYPAIGIMAFLLLEFVYADYSIFE